MTIEAHQLDIQGGEREGGREGGRIISEIPIYFDVSLGAGLPLMWWRRRHPSKTMVDIENKWAGTPVPVHRTSTGGR